jgi:hypothetical protein
MNRQVVGGAFYGDHLPDGSWVTIVPNVHFLTHIGIVPLPPGEPWGVGYPRCTNVGGFRFAGQAHTTVNPSCWEYNGAWIAYHEPCPGVSPVIYDNNGLLHRSDGSVGSQGYRYVTPQNVIVSGDATYGPFNGLSQYTDLGDSLWIGQAQDIEAVLLWDGTHNRLLETGSCTFVRANRAGDAVALAFSRPEGVVLITTSMSELRGLPIWHAPTPPEPTPIPPNPEPPKPEPPNPRPPKPEPPKPQLPYYKVKEYSPMSSEIVAIKGPGNKFGRVRQEDAGKGMFGWYPILFDRDAPDDDCWFELSKPDSRHVLRHTKIDGILGADATEHSADIPHQFYLKPGNDRGILESPVVIYSPTSELIGGYFEWPDKAVFGPSFCVVKQ